MKSNRRKRNRQYNRSNYHVSLKIGVIRIQSQHVLPP